MAIERAVKWRLELRRVPCCRGRPSFRDLSCPIQPEVLSLAGRIYRGTPFHSGEKNPEGEPDHANENEAGAV